jgi:hypothetical protein
MIARPALMFAALLGLAAAAEPAFAHHSAAMYDRDKRRPLVGVVKEFQWTNPHVWIQVVTTTPSGVREEWGVECTSVNFMTRRGWAKDTLKPGDKIELMISPLKDGSRGGGFLSVTSVNGKPLALEPEE